MRFSALSLGLLFASTTLAMAQPYETPEALIEAFYAPYFSQEFSDEDSSFRSERLNALYEADAEATPEGEIGALGFDPYIAGQDWELTDFAVAPARIQGDAATVVVTFENFGVDNELTYELVREDGGWKIDDLSGKSDDGEYRLSEIFEEASGGE